MSYFLCPHCGKETALFGRGTVERVARRLGVPYLGDLPINLDIRASGDSGDPAAVLDAAGPSAQAFSRLARSLSDQIAKRLATKAPPKVLAVRKEPPR